MKTTKADGTPYTCPFCHARVWFDEVWHRLFEVGGQGLHVVACPRRREWFRQRSYETQEEARSRRPHPLDVRRGDV